MSSATSRPSERARATKAWKSSSVPSAGWIALWPPAAPPMAHGLPTSSGPAVERVVRALAMGGADGVDRRQVEDVEAEIGDVGQPLGGVGEGAVLAVGCRSNAETARTRRRSARAADRRRPRARGRGAWRSGDRGGARRRPRAPGRARERRARRDRRAVGDLGGGVAEERSVGVVARRRRGALDGGAQQLGGAEELDGDVDLGLDLAAGSPRRSWPTRRPTTRPCTASVPSDGQRQRGVPAVVAERRERLLAPRASARPFASPSDGGDRARARRGCRGRRRGDRPRPRARRRRRA